MSDFTYHYCTIPQKWIYADLHEITSREEYFEMFQELVTEAIRACRVAGVKAEKYFPKENDHDFIKQNAILELTFEDTKTYLNPSDIAVTTERFSEFYVRERIFNVCRTLQRRATINNRQP